MGGGGSTYLPNGEMDVGRKPLRSPRGLPEAALWERELPSKGRWSQRHPDRHAAGEEAAIARTRRKMQAINKAYVAFKAPEPRRDFDPAEASVGCCMGSAAPEVQLQMCLRQAAGRLRQAGSRGDDEIGALIIGFL